MAWLIVLLIIVTILLAAVFILDKIEFREKGQEDVFRLDDLRQTITYKGETYARKQDVEALLVIGVDSYKGAHIDNYNNTDRADFLMLLGINKKEKSASVLQINRDTMANVKVLGVRGEPVGYRQEQITLAHTYGSGGEDSAINTVDAVSGLLYGLDIDHYISFTMDAVAEYADLVGGIEVERHFAEDVGLVSGDGWENAEPDEATGGDSAKSDEITGDGSDKSGSGEFYVLHGAEALQFVRNRDMYSIDANIERMERQRHFLSQLKKRTLEKEEEKMELFVLDAIMTVNEFMLSDCTVNQLSDYAEILVENTNNTIMTIEGENTAVSVGDGVSSVQFFADEDDVKAKMIEMFFEKE